MIKIVLTGPNGDKTLLMGLTIKNIEKLRTGKPIYVNGPELGFPGRIGVFYGDTGNDLIDQLKDVGLIPPGQEEKCRQHLKDDE